MVRGIHIMLILVLSAVPSWSNSLFNFPDPVDVDYQGIVNKLVHKSFMPVQLADLCVVTLWQPDEPKEVRAAYNEVVSISAWDRKANSQKIYDGRDNTIPPKKRNNRTNELFAWYMEERWWLEKESRYVTIDTGMRNNFMHDRRSKARAEPSQSPVRGLLSSIRVVGAHYRVLAG